MTAIVVAEESATDALLSLSAEEMKEAIAASQAARAAAAAVLSAKKNPEQHQDQQIKDDNDAVVVAVADDDDDDDDAVSVIEEDEEDDDDDDDDDEEVMELKDNQKEEEKEDDYYDDLANWIEHRRARRLLNCRVDLRWKSLRQFIACRELTGWTLGIQKEQQQQLLSSTSSNNNDVLVTCFEKALSNLELLQQLHDPSPARRYWKRKNEGIKDEETKRSAQGKTHSHQQEALDKWRSEWNDVPQVTLVIPPSRFSYSAATDNDKEEDEQSKTVSSLPNMYMIRIQNALYPNMHQAFRSLSACYNHHRVSSSSNDDLETLHDETSRVLPGLAAHYQKILELAYYYYKQGNETMTEAEDENDNVWSSDEMEWVLSRHIKLSSSSSSFSLNPLQNIETSSSSRLLHVVVPLTQSKHYTGGKLSISSNHRPVTKMKLKQYAAYIFPATSRHDEEEIRIDIEPTEGGTVEFIWNIYRGFPLLVQTPSKQGVEWKNNDNDNEKVENHNDEDRAHVEL